METSGPIFEHPLSVTAMLLFLIVLLLFLIALPRALRPKKKTKLNKIIARMEAEGLRKTTQEEATKEKAGEHLDALKNEPVKSPVLADEPSPLPSPKEIRPASKKKKKVIKESVSISHNEESTSLYKSGSGSKGSSQVKKPSWNDDFSTSSNEESGSNWVEAEIPGLIMEPFPAEKDSVTEPESKKPDPAQKKDPDKPKPKEILTFKAAPKPAHHFGEDEFEDFPSEKNLLSKVKGSAPKAVERTKARLPKPENIPKLGPKDVEIKAIVVSHKEIAEKEDGEGKAPAPSTGDQSTSGIEEPLEIEAIPPEREDRKSPLERPKPKPFFLDLKYLIEEKMKAGPESSKKLSPGMVDRIVARLNDLQSHLEHQLISPSGKGAPAERDIRHSRIQDAAPVVAGTTEVFSKKKEVSLEELDGFLFTANRKKAENEYQK